MRKHLRIIGREQPNHDEGLRSSSSAARMGRFVDEDWRYR
jgi:hypothetical protein